MTTPVWGAKIMILNRICLFEKKNMLYKWIIRDLVIIAVYFYCAFHTKWCFMGVIFFSGWVFQICVIFQLLFNTPLHDEKPVKKVRIIITVQK